MTRDRLAEHLDTTFEGIDETLLPAGIRFHRGKVRDIVKTGDRLILTTSDRISAFDRILTTIPLKGEVLNRMSVYWFRATEDIVDNHLLEEISSRTVAVQKAEVLPVEVVVRAYLTGSAWRDYQAHGRVSGIDLPPGMRFNERFERPLLTPSTKAEIGTHDEPVSAEEVVEKKLVDTDLWREIEKTAHALFERGTRLAAERGLILVDTKYEFGIDDGRLVLVDEIHTPDSSRYWYADTYEELFAKGEKQRKIDKEYLRQWLMEHGFMGNGEPPVIPDEMRLNVAERYITALETITGEEFTGSGNLPENEMGLILEYLG
jgi:phosphoribosylaminoimidazole-succinocarboxamide synthase